MGVDGGDDAMDSNRLVETLAKVAEICAENPSKAQHFAEFIANLPTLMGMKCREEKHGKAKKATIRDKKKRFEGAYPCDECGAKISTKSNLKRHKEVKHKEITEKAGQGKTESRKRGNSTEESKGCPEPKKRTTQATTAVTDAQSKTPGAKDPAKNLTKDLDIRSVSKEPVNNQIIDSDGRSVSKEPTAKTTTSKFDSQGKTPNDEKLAHNQTKDSDKRSLSKKPSAKPTKLEINSQIKTPDDRERFINPTRDSNGRSVSKEPAVRSRRESSIMALKKIQNYSLTAASYNFPENKTIVTDVKTPRTAKAPLLLYLCKCGVAAHSYDAAVQHSQRHLVLNYTPVTEPCIRCEFTFEVTCFVDHMRLHEDDVSRDDLKIVAYDYAKLMSPDWLNMFNQSQMNKYEIIASSVHEYTSSVKFNWESAEGAPVYQCDICRLCIDPGKVENHCGNYDSCLKNKRNGYSCNHCDLTFASEKVLNKHKAGKVRLVTFNSKKDLSFNNALQKAHYYQSSNGDQPRETNEAVETVRPMISDDTTSQYCKHCEKYIGYAEYEAHRALHEYEAKLKRIRIAREIEEAVANNDFTFENDPAVEALPKKLSVSNEGGGDVVPWESGSESCSSLIHSVVVVEAQINRSDHCNTHSVVACDKNVNNVTQETPEAFLENIFSPIETAVSYIEEETQSTQELLLASDSEESTENQSTRQENRCHHQNQSNTPKISHEMISILKKTKKIKNGMY